MNYCSRMFQEKQILCNIWSLCESKTSLSTHNPVLLSTANKVPHPYCVSKASRAHGGLQTIHTQTDEGQAIKLKEHFYLFIYLYILYCAISPLSPLKCEKHRKKVIFHCLSGHTWSLLFDSDLCFQHFISLWSQGSTSMPGLFSIHALKNHIHPFFPEHMSACLPTTQDDYCHLLVARMKSFALEHEHNSKI